MKVGDIEILPVSDGLVKLPQDYFGDTADWSAHQDLLDADGSLHAPIGCFVIRTGDRTVLVDCGLGPIEVAFLFGGQLPDAIGDEAALRA